MQCSLARTLEVIGDWWSPLVLRDLYLGLRRFDDLVADLGISRNLLTTRLSDLIAGGVVERVPYQERPQRFEYVLTDAGRDLIPVLMAMTAWGDRWATPDGGPPIRFEHDTERGGCGQQFVPAVHCSACGEPVTADAVRPVPGPGGREGPGTMLLPGVLTAR